MKIGESYTKEHKHTATAYRREVIQMWTCDHCELKITFEWLHFCKRHHHLNRISMIADKIQRFTIIRQLFGFIWDLLFFFFLIFETLSIIEEIGLKPFKVCSFALNTLFIRFRCIGWQYTHTHLNVKCFDAWILSVISIKTKSDIETIH